jgi:hypothetical protein
MGALVGIEDFGGGLGLHGFSMNIVGIVVIHDQELGVAGAGWEDESTSLVGEDLASAVGGGDKAVVGAATIEVGDWKGVVKVVDVRWVRGIDGRGGGMDAWFGGADVLAGLIKMAFDHRR